METSYDTESYEKIHAGNIVAGAHPKKCNSEAEWSEGYDRGVPKVEVMQRQIRCKVQIPQVDLWSCRVVSEWPETNHLEGFHDDEKEK